MSIEEITRRMGPGMAKFICKEVETVEDYDEYCHYVAGLVGYGLSRLFHASGLEDLAPVQIHFLIQWVYVFSGTMFVQFAMMVVLCQAGSPVCQRKIFFSAITSVVKS